MSKPDDGPAFPHENADTYFPGMLLRDYFAAKALPSILQQEDGGIQSFNPDSHRFSNSEVRAAELWAEQAYQIADAMLSERTK